MDHNLQSHDIPEPIYEQLLKPAAAQVEFRVASGLSSARVFCCRNPQGRLCLRGWPEIGPDLRRLEQMRQFVSLAHQQKIHVLPSYFTDARGQAFHWAGGRYWELTQWMPGVADYLRHPSQERLEAACEVLGQLHRVWSSQTQFGASPAVADRIERLRAWLHPPNALDIWQVNAGAASTRAFIEISTRSESRERQLWLATMQAIQRHGPRVHELLKAISDSEVGLHFVLRDVWSDHILFTGQQVTGVIDLGAARLDEPATDVARLLGSLEPRSAERFRLGIAAYQRQQPRLIKQRVVVLDYASCLLSAAQWAQWLVLEKRQFDADRNLLLERWEGFIQRVDAFPWDEMLEWAGGH